ncbi:MAG: MBL fold metallo-hydrolase [Spirochaetales bacterium]|nr:MBL fold metallo-hydrolase [Spirochaetales bacterium]
MVQRPCGKGALTLSNNGSLSCLFTGVGSAFSKRHYQTNLLIIKGDDHLMVDCGTRAPQALHELGVSIMDIKTFFITHSHADHIGGLEEAMLMDRYVMKKRPDIIIPQEYQNLLWDMSLKGGAAFNERHQGKYLSFEDLWQPLRPKRVKKNRRETWQYALGNLDLKMFRTMHIPDSAQGWEDSFWSFGILTDERFLFTGDTRFDPVLLDEFTAAYDPEIIFHDCQFFTGGVHSGLDELATLPAALKKNMLLVHYGDNWESMKKPVKDRGFKGLAKQWVYYDF